MAGLSHRHLLIVGLIAVALSLFNLEVQCQILSEVPLSFSGTDPAARQVLGLQPPIGASDAVSLGAARANTTTHVVISGSSALTGDLVPAASILTAGMVISVLPLEVNGPAPTLDLNGLGPRAVLKENGQPLDAGELRTGVPARLVFDGSAFRSITASFLGCPPAYAVVSNTYCITAQPGAAVTFFEAIEACSDQGGRLCTISEWSHACSSLPWFFGTVLQAEWVDHAANNTTGAKLVGVGIDGGGVGEGSGCAFGGQSPPTNPFPYRCCYNR
ncbi:MAG: hypothetical protein IT225_05470 [Flavobacteriales bacterium]|jgi:hypothetical protein|nr:hypothetical protein [Flavobacteriales bacterium]